ncbi:MAG: hypothetical protein ABIR96_06515 [Bdellovibrionota bacterium]
MDKLLKWECFKPERVRSIQANEKTRIEEECLRDTTHCDEKFLAEELRRRTVYLLSKNDFQSILSKTVSEIEYSRYDSFPSISYPYNTAPLLNNNFSRNWEVDVRALRLRSELKSKMTTRFYEAKNFKSSNPEERNILSHLSKSSDGKFCIGNVALNPPLTGTNEDDAHFQTWLHGLVSERDFSSVVQDLVIKEAPPTPGTH